MIILTKHAQVRIKIGFYGEPQKTIVKKEASKPTSLLLAASAHKKCDAEDKKTAEKVKTSHLVKTTKMKPTCTPSSSS
jgi:hypothetical protein